MWWLIPIAVAALFVGGLTLAAIMGWFDDNKTANSEYGELIKEKLANGNYRVVAGIFNKHGYQETTSQWETDELNNELKEKFGYRDHVYVKL